MTASIHLQSDEVSYLTRRQWDEPPAIPGIHVVAVSDRSELYDAQGRRKVIPTLRFGVGLFRWLVRHRRRFDVIQVANFPFWSILAVRAALAGTGVRVVVDWFEIWSGAFWRSYAGKVMGTVGCAVQRCCLALSPTIVVLSPSNAERLGATGRRDTPIVLAGLLPPEVESGDTGKGCTRVSSPLVLFAGRHISDKGVDLLPSVFAAVDRMAPGLRFVIAGDGPLRRWVTEECSRLELGSKVGVVGFVSDEELARLLSEASCVVVPSRREGYGFMPVDAMGRGTPVVTAGFEENLAVANIEAGRNGFVAAPPTAEEMAKAIVAVVALGPTLRETTLDWYQDHAPTKTVVCSVRQMVGLHSEWAGPDKGPGPFARR
jgi:glycosyltransferase involved in cell wall biosynthesis